MKITYLWIVSIARNSFRRIIGDHNFCHRRTHETPCRITPVHKRSRANQINSIILSAQLHNFLMNSFIQYLKWKVHKGDRKLTRPRSLLVQFDYARSQEQYNSPTVKFEKIVGKVVKKQRILISVILSALPCSNVMGKTKRVSLCLFSFSFRFTLASFLKPRQGILYQFPIFIYCFLER